MRTRSAVLYAPGERIRVEEIELDPPKDHEVQVRLVAAGVGNKEIARQLVISERMVEGHLDQLRRQLGLENPARVAVWAVTHGLAQ